jgi:hypothetical protein
MSASAASAIRDSFNSPNVCDSNGETANIVDVVQSLGVCVRDVARAITPFAAGSPGASGGHVESLTEAVMDASHGLASIASAINELAEAVSRFKMNVNVKADYTHQTTQAEQSK